MTDPTDAVAALAAIAALLVAMFFLFRSLPWSRPGPWRRIWSLAALAALMFILAEAGAVLDPHQPVGALGHQLPLFGVILAATAGFVATYFEAQRGAERERALALTDPLTGLRNRRALQERVTLALERGEHFTVLWADLEDFHLVNDALGSQAGDAVLQAVGQVMTRVGRSADTAARVGGDAFALFLSAAEESAARPVAERASSELATVVVGRPTGRRLTASFGAAGHADGRTAHQILEYAESAAARAGDAGDNHLAYAAEAVPVRVDGAVPNLRVR